MNYSNIIHCDIANGTGCRETLFVSGCRRHCPGCFNLIAQDFKAGKPFDKKTKEKFLENIKKPWIDGATILGGEPLEPENQTCVADLIKTIKETEPNKTIWLYTGFTYEELINHLLTDNIKTILDLTDVLVDGPFIENLKDISLDYRGSSNQRLIDLNAMRKTKTANILLRTIEHVSEL